MSNLIDRLWSGSRDLPMGSDLLTEAATAIATLEQQVEELTKELDNVKQVEFPRRVQKVTDALKRKHEKELAALAEQNEKMRKAFTKWRYLDSSYNWRCGHCGNEVEDGHKEGCALSLPDLKAEVSRAN